MRDAELRAAIAKLLRASAASDATSASDAEPPADAAQLAEVLDALRVIPVGPAGPVGAAGAAGDLQIMLGEKLVISGLTSSPHGAEQQRCLECMYFLVHRRWCDLPELAIPVEPEWWCRLWRA